MNKPDQASGVKTWELVAWVVVGALLTIPWVAMQFTDAIAWTASDFAIAGALLVGGLLLFRQLHSVTSNRAHRAGLAVAIVGAILLAWVNAAVGIIGSENNDANFVYSGILALGTLGALVSRFRPSGMFMTMSAVAAAQVIAGVAALVGDMGTDGANWPQDVIGLTAFFTALWIAAALLFRSASRTGDQI